MRKFKIFPLFTLLNLGFASANAYFYPEPVMLFILYSALGVSIISLYERVGVFMIIDSEGSDLKRLRSHFIWPITVYECYVFEKAMNRLNDLAGQLKALPEHEQSLSPLRKELRKCLIKIAPHEKKLKKYMEK